jgi:CDK inhibitor PHO81
VGFEICIIKAFKGVTLEIGGDIETYWKSMTTTIASPPKTSFSGPPPFSTSAHSSPSVCSGYGAKTRASFSALTVSSLQGQYIRVTVQVTKDLQPVICSEWILPGTGFDLGVCDVTLAQFESLASRLGRGIEYLAGSPDGLATLMPQAMVSLAKFFDVGHCL